MQRMMELGTPGAGHQRLEPMIGKFKTTGTFWTAPDQPPTQNEGTTTNSWDLDGRFLKQVFQGSYAGQPFTGLGYTGFNNLTQKYEGIWMDSMMTGMMPTSLGTADESGTVITFRREFVDAMTGEETTSREVLTIVDANRHTFEWYQPGPDGKEMMTMRFEYVRVP